MKANTKLAKRSDASRYSKIQTRGLTCNEVPERATDVGKLTQSSNRHTVNRTRLARMLANPDVKRWHDNLARGSKNTAENRVRILSRICDEHDMTPMQLAELGMRDARTAADFVEDHITSMESRSYSPGTIQTSLTTLKSWLRHFDVVIQRRIKVSNPNHTPTLADERVPTGAEMAEIYSRANLREKAIISLIAKSGLRPEVIGNHDGTDGLRMRDLVDVVIHRGVAVCSQYPSRVVVRPTLSKAKHQYFTYQTRAATVHLLAYLNDRISRGEPLGPDTAVIAEDTSSRSRGNNADRAFLPSRQISKVVRHVFRPRFSWRPYVLRSYFDTQLLIAESKGMIVHDFRVFFMGHHGSMEARYTTNKSVLPEALLKEMRESFVRAEELLDLELTPDTGAAEKRLEAQRELEDADSEQLGAMLEALKMIKAGKMCQASA